MSELELADLRCPSRSATIPSCYKDSVIVVHTGGYWRTNTNTKGDGACLYKDIGAERRYHVSDYIMIKWVKALLGPLTSLLDGQPQHTGHFATHSLPECRKRASQRL